MEKCKILHSSEISVDENLLYKQALRCIEKKWLNVEEEAVCIESYRSESGLYFSVIYGMSSHEGIDSVNVHCDKRSNSADVTEFFELVFRPEIVDKIIKNVDKNMPVVLSLQSETFMDTFVNKFNEVSNNKYAVKDEADLYLPSPSTAITSQVIPDLPDGYRFGKVQDKHVEFIARAWNQDLGDTPQNEDNEYEKKVKLNIRRLHFAIFHESDEFPVGWMNVHSDGTVGQLHVSPSHRRKGLARVILRKMYNIMNDVFSFGPFVNIYVENHTSAKFFSSEGWVKHNRASVYYRKYMYLKDYS